MKKLLALIKLYWIHRNNTRLYDDIWRRPDGACVTDDGLRMWDFQWKYSYPIMKERHLAPSKQR